MNSTNNNILIRDKVLWFVIQYYVSADNEVKNLRVLNRQFYKKTCKSLIIIIHKLIKSNI